MQPSFEYTIDAITRALSDTVGPAVDRGNSAAAEQLALAIGSLKVLRSQVDYCHWFEATEAYDMAEQANDLADLADLPGAAAARSAAAEARALAGRHDVRLSTLREANRELRRCISTLVEQAYGAGGEVSERVSALVLARSRRQIARERAYVAGAGFDVYPDTLQGIEAALQAS